MARHVRFYAALILLAVAFTLAMLATLEQARAQTWCGTSSWYGWEAGTHTANGDRWNPNGMTAAHRTLDFGVLVRVTRQDTGASVVVRINDRGPALWTGREIDLSLGAAMQLGMVELGLASVCLQVVEPER
jgi:rare lipoprotein A